MSDQTTTGGKSPRMVSMGFDTEPYPAGTHACLIFDNDEERRWLMARFVQSGLDADELVGYFVDTVTPEELKQSMRELGVVLPDALDDHQFSVLDAESVYCADGTFKIGRVLDNVAELHRRSVREGYVGARGTGEMTWATRGHPGSEDLIEYEARVNILVRTAPTTVVCQYDARLFDGGTLYQILCVHPMMVAHGQMIRNPYYIEPEAFLANLAGSSRL